MNSDNRFDLYSILAQPYPEFRVDDPQVERQETIDLVWARNPAGKDAVGTPYPNNLNLTLLCQRVPVPETVYEPGSNTPMDDIVTLLQNFKHLTCAHTCLKRNHKALEEKYEELKEYYDDLKNTCREFEDQINGFKHREEELVGKYNLLQETMDHDTRFRDYLLGKQSKRMEEIWALEKKNKQLEDMIDLGLDEPANNEQSESECD